MHELHELKEMLCEELKEYGSKDKLDVGGLEIVDKLAHAIKNIDKIIEAYEEDEYSMMDGGGSYENRGGAMRYNNGGTGSYRNSYARGRRNAKRDSMGRYSRDGYSRNEDIVMELRDLMQDVPDDRTKQEFQRLIQKMEQM